MEIFMVHRERVYQMVHGRAADCALVENTLEACSSCALRYNDPNEKPGDNPVYPCRGAMPLGSAFCLKGPQGGQMKIWRLYHDGS